MMRGDLKKRFKKIFFLTLLFLGNYSLLFAQDTIQKKDTTALKKQAIIVEKKDTIDLKKTVVINNKIFKVYNNWLTAGGGQAYNSALPKSQFVGGVDYNFHIQSRYFQLGFFLSGDAFGSYNNSMFHACYGGRNENAVYNLAYFVGVSYAIINPRDSNGYSYNSIPEIGVYGEVQLVRKISYDTGVGADLFVNANSRETIAGIRIIIYFSGAYQGPKNKYKEKPQTIY